MPAHEPWMLTQPFALRVLVVPQAELILNPRSYLSFLLPSSRFDERKNLSTSEKWNEGVVGPLAVDGRTNIGSSEAVVASHSSGGVACKFQGRLLAYRQFTYLASSSLSLLEAAQRAVLFPASAIQGVNEPGVCWLAPEQTAGKKKPFVYTQGQAVLNRAFFPCFDTPAVKCRYSALIEVPDGFTAVMSANTWEKRGPNKFFFQMCQPIPSYLIALAIGDLVSAEVGPRSRVWAEPCLIKAAKEEYNGVVEDFLATGEKLFGPYVWGRYDLLFMPPSFPFGGMENPCLTFVTPCLLAGDRSLADVIIHEISHSWFGNLVTNANWGEFWLNEGFTMYAQRRISTVLFGSAYTCLEAATGRALLRQHMDITGEENPLNKLRVKIEPGVDPDDTYNETPYEKGFCFVSYLAHLVGDQDEFDNFLKAYVNEFKFQSILADDFLEFYLEYFPELKKKRVDSIPGFEFDRWLNTPGWPPYLPDLSPGDSLMKPAEELAQLWVTKELDMKAIEAVAISTWKTYQLVYFLDKILQKSPLPPGNVKKLGETYPKISNSQNAELRLRWGQIVIKNDHQEDFWKVKEFLQSQGKQKYTLPLYHAMMGGSEVAQTLAKETFKATASQLHSNVVNYVQQIVAPKGS
ncbi:aminopeptidase b [Lynx pardinus]|uniref:Aminopeptidase b n=1 Tax=Lynx pardinus TaxID=191816 RepID=A0A485N1N2_LYNPA|nr:aminopeptidase b [Lynx pardinus]